MNGIAGLSYEQFTEISLALGIGGLMAFMIFIMYRLARESKAGGFGTLVIFVSLGLGLLGLVAKKIIEFTLDI